MKLTGNMLTISTKGIEDKHIYSEVLSVGDWEVRISPSTRYGYFEDIKNGSGGGGLWFANNTLVDYDGVFELPKIVADVLSYYGYDLGDNEPAEK